MSATPLRLPFALTLLASALLAGHVAPLAAQTADADSGAAESDPRRTYALPAGPLAEALTAFVAQSGVLVSADGALTRTRRSAGISGSYSAAEALTRLLAGTGLEAARQVNGTYALRLVRSSGEAPVLPAVKVTDTADALPGELPKPYAGGQVARGGGLGLMGNADRMDTPFSTVSITEQFARDVQAADITDVLRYDSSAQLDNFGVSPRVAFRGFYMAGEEAGVNGLYGISNYDGYKDVQPYERVEVIKGPTALLQGFVGGSSGASVNMVTKRATDQPITRIGASYESDTVGATSLDVGRRFGPSKQWGLRGNALYRDGIFADEDQDQETRLGSLALDYRGQRLRAAVDYIGHRQEANGTFGCSAYDLNQEPDRSRCPPNAHEAVDISGDQLLASVEYDVLDNLSVSLAHGRNDADLFFSQTYPSATDEEAGTQELTATAFVIHRRPRTSEARLRWTFATGPVAHELVVGTSRFENKDFFFYGEFPTGQIISTGTKFPDLSVSEPPPDYSGRQRYRSQAVVNRMSVLDERYQLIVGVRRQNVDTLSTFPGALPEEETRYDESATTPSVALLYKPTAQWMVYGSYIEGLKPGPTAPVDEPGSTLVYENPGEVFPPTQNEQYEFGAKWDGGMLGASLALFEISELNGITTPTGTPNVVRFGIDGEQRHRGLELSVFGEPLRGTRLLAGYTFIDAELVRTEGGLKDGDEVTGVPQHRAVLNGEYDLLALPGLTLTGTTTMVSDQNRAVSFDPSLDGHLPGYAIFDAGARYRWRRSRSWTLPARS